MPRTYDLDAAMTTLTRGRRYLLAAAAFGLLTTPLLLTVEKTPAPATPVAPREPVKRISATVMPAALRVAQPPPRVAQVGERSPFIVQAATADIARSAVLKVGGLVTGDLSIIRAVGA